MTLCHDHPLFRIWGWNTDLHIEILWDFKSTSSFLILGWNFACMILTCCNKHTNNVTLIFANRLYNRFFLIYFISYFHWLPRRNPVILNSLEGNSIFLSIREFRWIRCSFVPGVNVSLFYFLVLSWCEYLLHFHSFIFSVSFVRRNI